MGKQQTIDPLKSIYTDLGLDKEGVDYNSFTDTFKSNPEARRSVYDDLGLKSAGVDFETFEDKLGLKKKLQKSGSTDGLKESAPQSSIIQETNPLNPARVRMPGSFNFAQQVNPEMYNKVQKTQQDLQKAQSKRLQEINKTYDASQGEGTVASIQTGLDEAARNRITPTESTVNSVKNMVNRLQGTIPRLNIVAADTWENVLGEELAKKWYEFEGRDIDQVRNDAYEELGRLSQEVLPTLSLTSSIQDGSIKNVAAGIANAVTSLGSSALPALATGGAGIFTEMTGDALVDFNNAKAKKLGMTVPQLYESNQAEFGIPATIGALGGSLEAVGLIGIKNMMLKDVTGSLKKAAILFGVNSQKEGLTEWLQTGLEEANRSLGSGKSLEDASKQMWKKMWSKDGLESYLQGVAGSVGAGALGRVGKSLISPKAKTSFNEEVAKVDMMEMDLRNPEIDDTTKETIASEVNKSIGNMADIIEEDNKNEENLTPEQRVEAVRVNENIDEFQAIIDNPNVSERTKEIIQGQIDELNKQAESIKPEKTPEIVSTPIKKSSDAQIDDVIELEDGKKGKVTSIEGNMITVQLDNGATLTANPSFVEMSIVRPTEVTQSAEVSKPIETTTQEKESVVEPVNEEVSELQDMITQAEEIAVQHEQLAEIETDPVEKAEALEIARNAREVIEKSEQELLEISNEETAVEPTEEVVKEDVYQKRNEEILAKAEDDLKALKQVENKVKKYEAMIKRITEAKNNKEITVAQFNDLKKRYDEVIGESKPKTKEETIDAIKNGEIEPSSKSEREGTTEQQQGKQEDRINKEKPVSEGKTETSRSNRTEQGGKEQQKVSDNFYDLAHKSIESEEVRETLSNKERESGKELTQEEKEYKATKVMDAIRYGTEVVEEAKKEFGDSYASDLLTFVKENSKTLPVDKKSLILISLENDLERQLLADPNDLTLSKQAKMVTNELIKLQRTAAIATGMGRLRQLARVGYDITEITKEFFTPKQREARTKLVKAVESTSEDIQQEYETDIKDESVSEEVEKAIAEGIDRRINEIYDKLPSNRKQKADKAIAALDKIQKRLRSKTYEGTIGLPIAIIDAGITTIKAAIKAGVSIADAIELGINKIKEKHGKEWKKENEFREDMFTEFRREGINAESKNGFKSDTVKEALIAAGYGREITVTTKEGKQKRQILDWKKLTGEEGSLDNINTVIDNELGKKGYSESEIADIKQALKDEYNDLHASIIEKAEKELATRNKERTPAEIKSSARRLAELYNYGLFEKESDTYDKLINSAVGMSQLSNDSFLKAKNLAKSLAKLYTQRDANGQLMPDIAFKKAINSINSEIEALLTEIVSKEADWQYKAADVVGEYVSILQRDALVSGAQAIENSLSGYVERVFMDIGYRLSKVDTKALREQRKKLARTQFTDIVLNAGSDFGNITSPFIVKSRVMDKIAKLSDKQMYHWAVSVAMGRIFLEGADSMHKIALTEKFFTYNLIRILRKKGMSKEDAINFVSNKLTGQSFTDALKQSKELITQINSEAGKQILPDNPSNAFLLANDIVKNALLVGNKLSLKEVEASHKAAYMAAGFGLGHEANNPLSSSIGAENKKVQGELKTAIKEKDWGSAVNLRLKSILMNNIMNPYVGGGTNWIFLTAEKTGLNPLAYARMLRKIREIDLTSEQGVKNLQNDLYQSLKKRNSAIRTVVGAFIGLSIYAAATASDDDESLADWLKKNKWASKYFDKMAPTSAIWVMADNNDEMDIFLKKALGIRNNDYFSDSKKVLELAKLSYDRSEEQKIESMGALGELIGGKTGVPIVPWRLFRDVRNVYRGLNGLDPIKPDYTASGFWNGVFKAGLVDYLGFRPEAAKAKQLTSEEINKLIKEAEMKLKKAK